MRLHNLFFALILLSISLLACRKERTASQVQLEDSSRVYLELFDGKQMDGWEGNSEFYRIDSGAIIVGDTTREIPRNEFVCTEKRYRDFELKLEARLLGPGQNAGVQFRTERIPDHHEVIGYQCDMGFMPDRTIWASLYDESRRRKFLKHADPDSVLAVLKADDWNEFIIRCKGPEINFWLNGMPILHYTEPEDSIARSGKICLQIHSGPPAEASYRNIRLREL